jgi:hypothetical protein
MGKLENKTLAAGAEGCFGCGRQMSDREVKVLLPRYVQERNPYAGNGAAGRKFMCLSCYNRLRPSALARTAPRIGRIGLLQATC